MRTRVVLSVVLAAAFSSGASADAAERPARQRLTPDEIVPAKHATAVAGTSGVSGIQTTVLKGDPSKPGLYTIALKVPAHTQIEAHNHPDDRVATVISGTWYFGYGKQFNAKSLKELPAGSFYTEPPRDFHFARTAGEPVVLEITGFGPTGTTYWEHKP